MVCLVCYYCEMNCDVFGSFYLYMVFIGNLGIGKIIVVCILIKIYKVLGILEWGYMFEIDC